MTIEELETNNNYFLHHTASRHGRKSDLCGDGYPGHIVEYSGRFGHGFAVLTDRDVTYYISKNEPYEYYVYGDSYCVVGTTYAFDCRWDMEDSMGGPGTEIDVPDDLDDDPVVW